MPAPPSERDVRMRLAAFDFVRTLKAAYGEFIPAAAITAGFEFDGARQPIWSQRRGIYKPSRLGEDGAALSIQTSFNSPYDDRVSLDGGAMTYRYRGDDPASYDNLALRRAMNERRPLVYFVGTDRGYYDALWPVFVTRDDPAALLVELQVDASSTDTAAAEGKVLAGEEIRKAYTTVQVRRRVHQRRFRSRVVHAYDDQCAMCRLRRLELLDAAHILPDSEDASEPVVSNGLSLCKIHHSAYDVRILGVDPDYRVHVREDVLEEVDGPMLRHGLQEMHGSLLIVPRRAADQPDRELLAVQFDRFRAA